jgi:DNA (cytosine-5)-methyltransferase 1
MQSGQVSPSDTSKPLAELSLFSGLGGFSLGMRLAGLNIRTVAYVEIDPYCQAIIQQRIRDGLLDDAPIFSDISAFRGEQFRGLVDIISAGFPCQPHSVAGLRKSKDDSRNLWPDTLRVIREVEPRWVLLENVPGLLSASADGGTPAYGGTVVGELASIGFSVHWQTIGADDVGAPHRRKRWWCIGVADPLDDAEHDGQPSPQEPRGTGPRVHPQGGAQQPEQPAGPSGGATGGEELADIPTWPPSPGDTDGWAELLAERPDLAPALDKEVESRFRGVVDGRSHRVDELKALGNGIVPAVAAEFIRRISLAEERR